LFYAHAFSEIESELCFSWKGTKRTDELDC